MSVVKVNAFKGIFYIREAKLKFSCIYYTFLCPQYGYSSAQEYAYR